MTAKSPRRGGYNPHDKQDKPASWSLPYGAKTPHDAERMEAARIGLDAMLMDMDRKWGNGRLVMICRDNARAGYRRGWMAWSQAALSGDVDAFVRISEGLVRTLRIMDAQATEDGHAALPGDVIEAQLDDGRVLAIYRTSAEASAAVKDGRDVVAVSAAEIARLWPQFEVVGAIFDAWPGARVSSVVRPRSESFAADWARGDDLALHGDEAGIPVLPEEE